MIVRLPVNLPDDFAEKFSAATASGAPIEVKASFTPAQMTEAMADDRLRVGYLEDWAKQVQAAAEQQIHADRRQMFAQFGTVLNRAIQVLESHNDAGATERLTAELMRATDALEASSDAQPATQPVNVILKLPKNAINVNAIMPDTETVTSVEQDKHTGRIVRTHAKTRAIPTEGD